MSDFSDDELRTSLDLEAELRRSEARYRAFIHNSSEGIWRAETGQPIDVRLPADVQIQKIYETSYLAEANEAMARMYGYEHAAELEGAPLAALLPPDEPRNIDYLRAFIESGYQLLDSESIELDRHGNERRFLNNLTGVVEDGFLVRAWGTQRDVTEQRRAEQQLRQTNQLLTALSEATGALLYAKDLESRMTYANRATLEVLRRPAAEVLGRDPAELRTDRAELELILKNDRAVIESGQAQAFEEVVDVGGQRRVFLTIKAPCYDDRNQVNGIVGAAIDITARYQLEQERTRALARLQEEEVMRERLIGMLAHDLKSPLTAILMSGNMLMRSEGDRERRAAQRILTSGDRMQHLITQSLDLIQARQAGGLSIRPCDADLHRLVIEAVDELRVAHPTAAITLELRARPEGVWDPQRLMQLISNLIANAIQHGGGGAIQVRSRDEGEGITLEIRNDGPAIPEALQPVIFDPFRRMDRGSGGGARSVGLGLYIVREIVIAHRGRIDVESSDGDGTTFRVWLPRLSG